MAFIVDGHCKYSKMISRMQKDMHRLHANTVLYQGLMDMSFGSVGGLKPAPSPMDTERQLYIFEKMQSKAYSALRSKIVG